MLEITPSLDEALVREYCKKCGRLPGPQHYLYVASDRGEAVSAALFEVQSDRVIALWYEGPEDDAWLFDAVLRAGLNYASEQGIVSGYLPEAFRQAHGGLFSQINYPAQALFDITNFFQKYKSCNL